MKNSDMKIIAIILSIALFFTIVTSNAVSIASVVFLAKGETVQNGSSNTTGGSDASTPVDNGGSGATTPVDNGGSNATTPVDNGGSNATTPADNGGSNASTPATNGGSNASTPANNGSGSNGGATSNNATDKTAELVKQYTDAAKAVKAGKAGFSRKTWQAIQEVNLGSLGDKLLPIIQKFMTTEEEATVKTFTKAEAKDKMPASTFTVADVASATSTAKGNNTVITIILKDEQSPTKDAPTGVAAAAGHEILYMEDVKKEISENYSFIKLSNESMTYKGFKIVAEVTKDGKLVDVMMSCPGYLAATVSVAIVTLNADGILNFYSHYSNFKY